jgi:hypothetical protein
MRNWRKYILKNIDSETRRLVRRIQVVSPAQCTKLVDTNVLRGEMIGKLKNICGSGIQGKDQREQLALSFVS